MKSKANIHVYTPTYQHAVAAIDVGVSVISLNGPALGLRGEKSFLTWDQINELRKNQQIKILLRINTVIHNQDIDILSQMLTKAESLGIDAIIYNDIAVLQYATELGITLPLHLETETTVTNIEMIRFWNQQGVSNFLLSRELSFLQIKNMINQKQAMKHTNIVYSLLERDVTCEKSQRVRESEP